MKRILQKSFAWLVMIVAMFAGSTCAMAQYATFNYQNGAHQYVQNVTVNTVTVSADWSWQAAWDGLALNRDDYFGDNNGFTVTCNDAKITKIVLDANTNNFMTDKPSYTASTSTWEGSANSVKFNLASDGDVYVYEVQVWIEAAAPSTTFAFGTTNIEDGDVYTEVFTYGLTLNHGGTLHFADDKSVSDIKVNGTPMDAGTDVLFNPSSTWINYTFGEDGANTIEIPEGVFVNDADKTNEALTISFTINLPFFTMSSAEWTTFSGSSAWKMPTGYVGYIASDIENGHVVLTKKFEAGADIIGGYPVIINGPAAAKVVIEKGSSSSGDSQFLYSNNSDVAQTYYASQMWNYMQKVGECADYTNCYVFKLSYDSDGKNLGFYYDSPDGRSIYCQPHKAFLVVPASKLGGASSSNGLKIRFADEEVTGINAIATESNDVIYNLQGQRVNATKAGIYVKNGKKFIVK